MSIYDHITAELIEKKVMNTLSYNLDLLFISKYKGRKMVHLNSEVCTYFREN